MKNWKQHFPLSIFFCVLKILLHWESELKVAIRLDVAISKLVSNRPFLPTHKNTSKQKSIILLNYFQSKNHNVLCFELLENSDYDTQCPTKWVTVKSTNSKKSKPKTCGALKLIETSTYLMNRWKECTISSKLPI